MTPHGEYELPLDYLNLKLKSFCGDQKLERELINLLQMKVYVSCKRLSNRMQTQKSSFKNQNLITLYLIAQEDHRKIINVHLLLVYPKEL